MRIQSQAQQTELLSGVSRTFALTIPLLPEPLCQVVTNAYLLCRIADTIEDDPKLTPEEKNYFNAQFCNVLDKKVDATLYAQELLNQVSAQIPHKEYELLQQLPQVVDFFHSFTLTQQLPIRRCVGIMSEGMVEFARQANLQGLETMAQLDRYCYVVAGVVGEMLTELFCEYAPQMQQHKEKAMEYAVNFGQGLQMTNILQDIWQDKARGICWLPRNIFANFGIDLDLRNPTPKDFAKAIQQLVLIAYQHLQKAMDYVTLIPANETQIKRFALLPINLAVLTLTHIYHQPNFSHRNEVKVTRRTVKLLLLSNYVTSYSPFLAKQLFLFLSKGFYYNHHT